jgi:surface antigen
MLSTAFVRREIRKGAWMNRVKPRPFQYLIHDISRACLIRASVLALLALPCVSLATPPSWAPAHGWRKKNDPNYDGYSGRTYLSDYGVLQGRCDFAAVGAVVGGIAGAAIGATTASPESRPVAIVVGTVIGAALGSEIGKRMDRTDRSCAGHALELAGPQQTVSWTNAKTNFTYQLTPLSDPDRASDGCRRFRLVAQGPYGISEGRTTACIDAGGNWRLAPEARLSRM